MATAGRAQKPVGSSAWISTEKENVSQLVDQEIEEVEYPVSHEMDWLNEHMGEIFNNNQFNFTDVFKTPGKMRGKTPRTARKRNVEESRMPLSEIFSTVHNKAEKKANASSKCSPAKTAAPTTTTAAVNANPAAENTSQPQYPDPSQNLNSFPKYNTDSGYHGMPDDEEDYDDDVVLTQVQTESQASTRPLENEPASDASQAHGPFEITETSFHSAREDIRQRGETAEPMSIDPTPNHKTEVHPPKPQSKDKDPEAMPVPTELEDEPEAEPQQEVERGTEEEPGKKSEKEPEQKLEQEVRSKPAQDPQPRSEQELESEPEQDLESDEEPEPETEPESVQNTKSSPMKTPATLPPQPRQEEEEEEEEEGVEIEKEDMALDTLDDIGSPSDGSTPERPPIRKSSLTFASLPAREPLMKKSLGGTRMSRTSHVDVAKLNNTGSSGYLGRQTGGHRTTQAALDENDKMDIDEGAREGTDADTRASKLHNKSSTQRLHEKISMLGKLQPSRPTKSIPSVSGLSGAQVSYPDLPPVVKMETKPEASNRRSRETPAPEPMATDDDWIKPLNTPQRPNMARNQTMDAMKSSGTATNPVFAQNHDGRMANPSDKDRGKSTTPMYSPQRPSHQKSASASILPGEASTTPVGSPASQEAPLSASKWRLQSIMKSAKGLFTNAGGVSAAARVEASSPKGSQEQADDRVKAHHAADDRQESQPPQAPTPPKQEGRRTRSSTEKEEKRKQKEINEQEEENAREQEKQRAIQLKAAQEKASLENEGRAAASAAPPSPKKIPQPQKHSSKEPEPTHDTGSKSAIPPPGSQQLQKQSERRPAKPTREPLQKPRPQPVSIRVGSALSRQIPVPSNNNVRESTAPAPTPASASKPSTLKKNASNNSLHTASSNSSFKSSVSSNSQRKAQLASERKKEQEEREVRRKEEQKREMERKRAAQQQEEARRQELRSRAEAERRERERHASEDPKKAAHMQAIEKRRLENAKRMERQGSQQPANDTSSLHQQERPASQASRPASRLGSIQPFGRTINPPQPNPAKPPKRALDDETSHRPAPSKPSTIQPSGDSKRRRTEDEHNQPPSMRPTMAPPIRQSNIRKEPTKPSTFSSGQPSTAHRSGSSIFKTAQPQRPAHPMDMSKYASGKIPFAEPSNASQPATNKAPSASSSQKAPTKQSPKYPSGENIHLPEIATDSEDEDSEAEMLPIPKWAQPKELDGLLRQQEGMEVDSIFGPIAPFSLEDTFKADKKIKKFRERTSSANWSGADRLTQEEIRKDLAERQRLRLNGGWTYESQ